MSDWHKGRFTVTELTRITPSLYQNLMSGEKSFPSITFAKTDPDDWGPGFGLTVEFENTNDLRILHAAAGELLAELSNT